MEQQKLPNATTSIVLGIISFICCLFTVGLGGILFSGIALFLANRDKNTYTEDPESYYNYNQVKTARIIAIIGLVLGILTVLMVAYSIKAMGGWDMYWEQVEETMEEIQGY